MTTRKVPHPTLEERREAGRLARRRMPRSSLEGWQPAADRPDPVGLLQTQNEAREPDLVPVRHGRMMVSPFTFYRGGAKIMAADLAHIPRAGLDVQLCGDAHLSNFGAYASPARTLVFDLNDFDETLPGPFEYDVARLAASFAVASRDNGFKASRSAEAAAASVAAYRTAMAGFAGMRTLDVWYSRVDAQEIVEKATAGVKKSRRKLAAAAEKNIAKVRTKDSLQALSKLTEVVDGYHRIISAPPVVVPARELAETYGFAPDELRAMLQERLRSYRSTLPYDRRRVLERFEFVDFARKVVGVGSVGTRAWIALLQGRDGEDPLFLQIKEATASVLEDHLPKSRFRQPGERVVQGQRLMQAASDILLGWTKGVQEGRFYYWRQLRDMKGSALIELFDPEAMNYYAGVCGWTLARAHARSGDPVAISAYLGSSDRFDRAMTDFAVRYADQNERDYDAFAQAIRSGKLEATEGV
ncbi:MAG: DUF2252 domain-containing protein [Acidimicrobiales bacterium]